MSKVNLQKDVFTTFDVAKICNANITSIKNWIAGEKLSAFKTPGGHFRIERAALIEFLDQFQMPNPFAAVTRPCVICTRDHASHSDLRLALSRRFELFSACDTLEAALLIGEKSPIGFVQEIADLEEDTRLLSLLRSHHAFEQMTLIALVSDTSPGEEALRLNLVDAFLLETADPEHLESTLSSVFSRPIS